jgi:plastocyanin
MVAVAIGLLAGASLGEAANHRAKPTRSCRWRHHHHVCPTRHTRPRRVTTSSSSSTSAASSTSTTTTTATTTHTQTTATQTTASSTTQASLPRGTEVDENATGQQSPFYALTPYEPTLAAGTIHFNVYNYDQDPHTFAIADTQGHQISATFQVPAGHTGTPVTVTANLAPGTYVLFCTLPQHAASGMQSTIVVK